MLSAMLPPSSVPILLVQGTFLFLSAHPGLTFRLPFLFRNRPAVNYETLRYKNDVPLVFAFCNADKIRNLLSQSSTGAQSALVEGLNNDIEQKLNNKPTSEGLEMPDGNEIMPGRPNDKKLISVSEPEHNTQLAADVPAKPPPPVTTAATSTNKSESEDGGARGGSSEVSTAAPPHTTLAPTGRRKRRSLADLASSALELAKVGPGVQGDMVGAALEMASSVAADKVRAAAEGGGQVLAGVPGPVGRITAKGLTAAGSLAGKALQVAGSGGGAVVRTLGSAADSVVEFLGVG